MSIRHSACWWAVLGFFIDQENATISAAIDKTNAWFTTSNPMLGGLIPNEMIDMGKDEKLYTIIRSALAENSKL